MTAATLVDDRLDTREAAFILSGPPRAALPQPSRLAGLMRALAAPLLLAVVLQNIGNLALHAVLGRVLTADQYGALGTVLSLMVMLTVPLSALQAAASKAATAGPSASAAQRRSVRTILLVALAVAVPVAVSAPALVSVFTLPSLLDALVLAPFVAISIVLAVVRGRLLGLDQRSGVRAVAVTFVLSTLVRVTLSVALIGRIGTSAAIIATLVGEACALLYAVRALPGREAASRRPAADNPWLSWSDVGWSGLAIGGLFLFTTIDLFLARHFLPGDVSGSYVAAATIGKTLLALPAAALAAAYPRLVGVGRGPGRSLELKRTAIVVVGLAVLAAFVVAAVPGMVLHGLYGSSFSDAAGLVRILALVAGTSAAVSLATYALLAVGSRWSLLPWLGALVELGLISVRHSSATQIAMASGAALLVTLLLCVGALMLDVRTRARGVHTA